MKNNNHALIATFTDGEQHQCYDPELGMTLQEAASKIPVLVADYRRAVDAGWMKEVPVISIVSQKEAQALQEMLAHKRLPNPFDHRTNKPQRKAGDNNMAKNNRLTKAEKQKVFNIVAGRLLKQGEQSSARVQTPFGMAESCVYRKKMKTGPDLKCAVGQLIPKTAYREEFDSRNPKGFGGVGFHISVLVKMIDRDKLSPLNKKALSKTNVRFLADLQGWHDASDAPKGAAFRKQLAVNAKDFAGKYMLELPNSLKAYL